MSVPQTPVPPLGMVRHPRGWAFQVTTTTIYLLLIEITVLFGAVSAWLIHRQTSKPGAGMPGKFGRKGLKRGFRPTLHELEDHKPVPWGWPNYTPRHPPRIGKPDMAEAMYTLMDCIMMEKRLITEGGFHLANDRSAGAPLTAGDDSGLSGGRLTARLEKKTAASYGSDESVDITDVFGRSKNVLKYSRQGRVASEQALYKKTDSDLNFKKFEETEILQPWGW
jgi:hypothetical protein